MTEAPNIDPSKELPMSEQKFDIILSNVLRFGLVAASCLMAIGALVHFVQAPASTLSMQQFHGEPEELKRIPSILSLAAHGSGLGLMQTAVLVLLATPFMRVVFAAYGFAKQTDWKYVVISLIVLANLLYGLLSGRGGG